MFNFIETLSGRLELAGVSFSVKIHHISQTTDSGATDRSDYKMMFYSYRWFLSPKRHVTYYFQNINFDEIERKYYWDTVETSEVTCSVICSKRKKRGCEKGAFCDKRKEERRKALEKASRERLRKIKLKLNRLEKSVFDNKSINIFLTDIPDDSNPAYTVFKTKEGVKIHVVDEEIIPHLTDEDIIRTPRTDFTSTLFFDLFFGLFNKEVTRASPGRTS